MPRYFFHVYDGYSAIDRDGTELPDIDTAQAQAIRLSGELLRELPRSSNKDGTGLQRGRWL